MAHRIVMETPASLGRKVSSRFSERPASEKEKGKRRKEEKLEKC